MCFKDNQLCLLFNVSICTYHIVVLLVDHFVGRLVAAYVAWLTKCWQPSRRCEILSLWLRFSDSSINGLVSSQVNIWPWFALVGFSRAIVTCIIMNDRDLSVHMYLRPLVHTIISGAVNIRVCLDRFITCPFFHFLNWAQRAKFKMESRGEWNWKGRILI